MSGKPPGKPRKGASSSNKTSSSKGSAQNAAKVTPIRENKRASQEIAVQQNHEADRHNGSGRTDQEITGQEIMEQIRVRAYELFEERGRHEGFEQEDWIRAEAEVLARFQGEKSA